MIAYDPRDMTWDEYNKLMFDLFSSSQLGFVQRSVGETGLMGSMVLEILSNQASQTTGILTVGKIGLLLL